MTVVIAWVSEPKPARAEGGLTLAEAYALAIRHFEGIQIADADVERAKLAPYRALTTVTPSLSVIGSFTREKEQIEFNTPPGFEFFGDSPVVVPQDVGRGSLEVRQTLWTFQLLPLWREAQLEIDTARSARQVAVQQTAFVTAQAFFDVLRARAQLAVAQESLNLAEAEQNRARLRHGVGEIVKTDVLRAEVTTTQARQILTAAENGVRLAERNLARIIDLESIGSLVEPTTLPLPSHDLGGALTIAEEQRPDLIRQEALFDAAVEEQKRRLGVLLPTLSAEWRYRLTSEETFAERNDFWTAIVALRIPLFDRGGAPIVELQEQKQEVEKARLAVQSLRKNVRLEVEQTWLELDTLTVNLATARDEQRLAAETYSLVSKQFDAGTATSLEVTTALTDRQRASLRLVDIRARHAVAIIALRRAVGVLAEDAGLAAEGTR